jgi:hypothetical protein
MTFIDHRTTSAYHPLANGMAERSVQTINRALAKIAGLKTDSWDALLPYTILGSNTSVQTYTVFSTYHLLHAVRATLPSIIATPTSWTYRT